MKPIYYLSHLSKSLYFFCLSVFKREPGGEVKHVATSPGQGQWRFFMMVSDLSRYGASHLLSRTRIHVTTRRVNQDFMDGRTVSGPTPLDQQGQTGTRHHHGPACLTAASPAYPVIGKALYRNKFTLCGGYRAIYHTIAPTNRNSPKSKTSSYRCMRKLGASFFDKAKRQIN